MDFYQIKEREGDGKKTGVVEVYPDFKVVRSKDLMIKSKGFYGVWDAENNLWSTDEYDVQRLVDAELIEYVPKATMVTEVHRKLLGNWSSSSWLQFRNYLGHLSDTFHPLDENLTFANTKVKKEDYVSKRLPYALANGDVSAYDELIGTLYDPDERAKLEWAVGAIVSGDSKSIQKFLVLYGSHGTGKSTWLTIVQWLFEGYFATFDAAAITSVNNQFALEAFKSNPLVGIQHDGDLSKIADNSKLNSLVSHEWMTMNEKFKSSYDAKFWAFLIVASNKPVKITDAKSGLIRRMIDVHPSGRLVGPRKYQTLMNQIQFELGAIAAYCLEVYQSMGKDYYSGYRPEEMMLQTDVFFNFVEANWDIFKQQDGATLKQAYELYKEYCKDTNVDWVMPQYKFREELKNYFAKFEERAEVDGVRVRSWYSEFNADKYKIKAPEEKMFSLVMEETESLLDARYAEYFAQYANEEGTPRVKWEQVKTKLKDLDTSKLHYVNVEDDHEIVVDFDLKDADGNKSAERNLEAASQWPPTYAEFSKSGEGIHLHYYWDGDPSELSALYAEGIEIKVFRGDASLRRGFTRGNNVGVATLSSGLPIKEKKMITDQRVKTEKGLRDMINKNLRKEIHQGTKPSMDFIHHILEEAYDDGLTYDVTDLRNKILAFATNSTHHNLYCIKLVQTMKFKSEDVIEAIEETKPTPKDERIVLFDVEVFPNLFIICWKYQGSPTVVRMINPTAQQVEELFALKLAGYNCRRYDNHILYAASLGYTIEQLYKLSQKIINGVANSLFGAAYNISYLDIFDMANTKMSLKKWEITLGIAHKENALPWDQPVPENKWKQVADYCENDVEATEKVLEYLEADYIARQLLADMSGLPLNSTTQQHASRIVFGEDSRPQEKFVYTDLSKQFPGYSYEMGRSTYRGEITGEGGYVHAEPGIYENVALLDVESMHPTSIEALDLFGEYTQRFSDLKTARLAIKHKDFEQARTVLGGKLAKYLKDDTDATKLSYALKIVINIVYGLTSARFENSFKDPRNIDNIVAKRGALFMIDLKHFVQEKGFTVAHIKTDSIKIPNATADIIAAVMEFGARYGYTFQHEATYTKMCLVNDAVYAAKAEDGHWETVGAQFQHPYVKKALFTKEPIEFKDKCETKQVTTAMYLDFEDRDIPMALLDGTEAFKTEEGELFFIGKVGSFCPMLEGGGKLLREKDGKFGAVVGTKGWNWLEAELVKTLGLEPEIDLTYFYKLVDAAIDQIKKFGDYEWFVS